MGAICVIHGENNVGKSNVLEAMQLFFQLVCFNRAWFAQYRSEDLAQLGVKVNEIFHFESEILITMMAVLKIDSSHLPPQPEMNSLLMKFKVRWKLSKRCDISMKNFQHFIS